MRRRMRLGLADPVVTNRFLLWGIGAGAAGVGSAVGGAVQWWTQLPPIELPWVMLSSSLHGLVAAMAMWLAFVPSAPYTRLIRAPRGMIGSLAQTFSASKRMPVAPRTPPRASPRGRVVRAPALDATLRGGPHISAKPPGPK